MVTPTTPDLATVRAAVQAEIDALPRLRYTPRLASRADAALIVPLAQKYCVGPTDCGWEPHTTGRVSPERVLRWLPVLTEGRRAPVCFQVYVPALLPRCEVAALALDMSLPEPRRLEAIFVGAVPVYRALIKLGWDTVFAAQVPVDVLPVAGQMDNDSLIASDDDDARRRIETTGRSVAPGATLPRSLAVPMARWLTFMERVLGL